jgi:hypothetical protein
MWAAGIISQIDGGLAVVGIILIARLVGGLRSMNIK